MILGFVGSSNDVLVRAGVVSCVNICLSDPVCIFSTQSVTGWSNGVASLGQDIANEAFEL